MGSGFANPWMLFAALSLAVPVLLHLVTREERQGQGFPSLMFLRRTPYQARRRKTLRDRLLLALRLLALLLLVLAFAGPQWPQRAAEPAAASQAVRDTVLLLDTSYSMAAPERWNALIERAGRHIDAMTGDERIGLVSFADQARLLSAPVGDAALLRARLAGLRPGAQSTRLAPALAQALELLRESPAAARRILLISDLQRSALGGAAGGAPLLLDSGIELEVDAISETVARNAALLAAHLDNPTPEQHRLTVSLANTGTQPLERVALRLEMDGRVQQRDSPGLAPGERRAFEFEVVPALDRSLPLRLSLADDDLPGDNGFVLVLHPDAPVDIGLLAGAGSGLADARAHLAGALALAQKPRLRLHDLRADAGLAADLAQVQVLIADRPSLQAPGVATAVAGFLDRGGGLLAVAADGFSALAEARDERRHAGRGLGLRRPSAAIEPALDLVSLFDGLSGVRVYRSHDLPTAGGRPLMTLEDGSPWLVAAPVTAGRRLDLHSGLTGNWSNLVLEPGFVPLLQRWVLYLAGREAAPAALQPGEVIDLARLSAAVPTAAGWRGYLAAGGRAVIEQPDGTTRPLAAGQTLYRVAGAGLYQAHRGDGVPPALHFAVNSERAESLLAAASVDELLQRISRRPAPAAPAPSGTASTAGQGLPAGWLLLLAAGLLLLAELWLANRLALHRQPAQTVATSGANPAPAGGR